MRCTENNLEEPYFQCSSDQYQEIMVVSSVLVTLCNITVKLHKKLLAKNSIQ